jgi:hypothetical protein
MNRQKLKSALWIVFVPVAYALFLRIVFDLDIIRNFAQVMSITFLISLPFGVGVITIALSGIEKVKSLSYRICMPWLPIGLFFILTLLLNIEGWACWIMISPIFLIFGSIGGLTAGYFKLKKLRNENKLNVSFVFLMPVILLSFENLLPALPARYEAYTYSDIHSAKQKIWNNVINVKTISTENDKGTFTNFLGFPRPVKAELNFAAVGGSRKAIFSKGLVFDEVVKEYEHEKSMRFSIKANPYNIPSATMDKHVVIGGDYFDVLDGTYKLEQLNNTTWRLHLFSHFELKTTFNFYASWWAGWIMKDIQNNILQVIKKRSENG